MYDKKMSYKALDSNQFVEKMINEDEDNGDVFEVCDGGVDYDGSPYLNVVAHKERVLREEVEKEFNDQAVKYGWKFETFKYSSSAVYSIASEGDSILIVYFERCKSKEVK